jgi:hypothetical protein
MSSVTVPTPIMPPGRRLERVLSEAAAITCPPYRGSNSISHRYWQGIGHGYDLCCPNGQYTGGECFPPAVNPLGFTRTRRGFNRPAAGEHGKKGADESHALDGLLLSRLRQASSDQ